MDKQKYKEVSDNKLISYSGMNNNDPIKQFSNVFV